MDCEHRRVCVVCASCVSCPMNPDFNKKRDQLILALLMLIRSMPVNLRVQRYQEYWEKASLKQLEDDAKKLEINIEKARKNPQEFYEMELGLGG